MHQPVDQGHGQGVVHVEGLRHSRKGRFVVITIDPKFITGGDNLEQRIGTTLVDGQIAQLVEEGAKRTIATLAALAKPSDDSPIEP